jgi:multiple sugar transport system substrate-binding protein
MHESALGDYVRRHLVLPLDRDFTAAGIATGDFTAHARRGVTFAGETYALPFDTWSWLWHVNTSLMKQAGLLDAAGRPVVPRSPQELLAHARQFRRATGKPYFAWAAANEPAANTRTFLTLVAQHDARLFGGNGKPIDMHQPAVVDALGLMRQLYAEGHVKPNLGYVGANQAFLRGEVGGGGGDLGDRPVPERIAVGRLAIVRRLYRAAVPATLRAQGCVCRWPCVGDAGCRLPR